MLLLQQMQEVPRMKLVVCFFLTGFVAGYGATKCYTVYILGGGWRPPLLWEVWSWDSRGGEMGGWVELA